MTTMSHPLSKRDNGLHHSLGATIADEMRPHHTATMPLVQRRPVKATDAYNAGLHPLQHPWTLWYYKREKNLEWEKCQNPLLTVETVEDFWALINNIIPPSGLPDNCDYSLFKEGIKPMWEDPKNYNGGRWNIPIIKQCQENGVLNDAWIEVTLCLIGEMLNEYGSFINGAVVAVRGKVDKISVWLGECTDREVIQAIGKFIKGRLNISQIIHYEFHSDAIKRVHKAKLSV